MISTSKTVNLFYYQNYFITEIDIDFFDIASIKQVDTLDDKFEKTTYIYILILELNKQFLFESAVSLYIGKILSIFLYPQISLCDFTDFNLLRYQLHSIFVEYLLFISMFMNLVFCQLFIKYFSKRF